MCVPPQWNRRRRRAAAAEERLERNKSEAVEVKADLHSRSGVTAATKVISKSL